MKKLFVCLILVFILMFSWIDRGNARELTYNFFGSFSTGDFIGRPFSGNFRYNTNGDPATQFDFSSVAGGRLVYDPDSYIHALGTDLSVAGSWSFLVLGVAASWEIAANFNAPVNLSQPLPLTSFTGGAIEFRTLYTGYKNGGFVTELTESSGPLSSLTLVPEPCTMLLFGCGLIGLAGWRRKFKG